MKRLGRSVVALHCGRLGRSYFARLELARQPKTPDAAIHRLASLLLALPPSARRLYIRATSLELNIGIQSGTEPAHSELALRRRTVAMAARLGARIVITTYGTK